MTGHTVLLKPENLQVTGSFKIRGAYNKIASLSEEELARGIVNRLAGNHAQGVAYGRPRTRREGHDPDAHDHPAVEGRRHQGLRCRRGAARRRVDEAAAYAAELSEKQGMVYVPPFDDYEVLCGQGTIAMEIPGRRAGRHRHRRAAGRRWAGCRRGARRQDVPPRGAGDRCDPEGSPAFKNSLAAGRVVAADQVVTSAEGVAVKRPGDLTFALLNEFLDDLVTVSERDINEMILLMLEKHKLVVEAAGAGPWRR